jgi:hypothetical protein
MTGAVALAALIGLASLLAGVALGWYLRAANIGCAECGDQLTCVACRSRAARPRERATSLP